MVYQPKKCFEGNTVCPNHDRLVLYKNEKKFCLKFRVKTKKKKSLYFDSSPISQFLSQKSSDVSLKKRSSPQRNRFSVFGNFALQK